MSEKKRVESCWRGEREKGLEPIDLKNRASEGPSIDRREKKKNSTSALLHQKKKKKKSSDKKQLGAPLRIGEGATFHSLSTDAYSLHCLESPTGLKFVLTTTESEGGAAATAGAAAAAAGGTAGSGAAAAAGGSSSSSSGGQQQQLQSGHPDIRDVLARIYAYAYVDGAARSPSFRRGEPFAFELFSQRLRACLGGLLPNGGGTAAR